MNKSGFAIYLENNLITEIDIDKDARKVICLNSSGVQKIFHFGKKYAAMTLGELKKDGHIVWSGYDGKDWLFISNEDYGFQKIAEF